MPETFDYDVFLSHSSQDRDVVRPLAERLRADGLRVWLDEWEIRPGDSIPAKIEEGLERSRVLVLCMSANAFGSDWGALESGTFRFRDPLNRERRFIPLRLDDAPIKGSLAQFLYVDWRGEERDDAYGRLVEACRSVAVISTVETEARRKQFEERVVSLGHTGPIRSVALSADGHRAVTGSDDGTVRVWDVDGGVCERVLEGHTGSVTSVALSVDDLRAVSGSSDATIRVWDLERGVCERVLEGHTGWVNSLELSLDGLRAVTGSYDATVRVWDLERGVCERVLEGHTGWVNSVVLSVDGHRAVTGSYDATVRVWDLERGVCERVLEGHTSGVWSVALSVDGLRATSAASNGVMRIWDLSQLGSESHASDSESLEQVQYTNAKVLLVGDSGVGKTGISNRLAHDRFEETESTDGAWATHWPLPQTKSDDGVDREIWLWDFAGQVDYRLVHQLFMDHTAAAVLVFNPQNENPFEGLGHWDRDLQKAARKPFAKLLAAGRADRGGLVVSAARMQKFMTERGFLPPLHLTSAKTGDGCTEIRDAIAGAIDWKSIPLTTSPALYHRMKQEILALRDKGLVLIRLAELNQRMELTLRDEDFKPDELNAVIGLLAGPGMILRLDFGGFILLRPEVLSRYAAALVRKVRAHPQELGCIREEEMLAGDLDYRDFERLVREDEVIVLRALHEIAVKRAWCLRQDSERGAILTFPSYFRRERPEGPAHPAVLASYRFCGAVDEIYATLVVRLHHTSMLETTDLWKDAADFRTQTGAALGVMLHREGEGHFRLDAWFTQQVSDDARIVFERYVFDHLNEHAQEVERLRNYCCGNRRCAVHGQPFADRAAIDRALAPGGKGKVFCPECGKGLVLRDVIEEKFNSPAVKEEAREMKFEGQSIIDNESRELILVGHAFAITGEAGQIYRGYTNSDHGIDGEIEFKDDLGRASGKRLYIQLKSGDSYLKKRGRYGAEVFHIKNPRWADYWQQQAYAVMLVIRTSDGTIRWMDVSAYLKRESFNGSKVTQVVFDGERFDALSVRRWRDKMLGK